METFEINTRPIGSIRKKCGARDGSRNGTINRREEGTEAEMRAPVNNKAQTMSALELALRSAIRADRDSAMAYVLIIRKYSRQRFLQREPALSITLRETFDAAAFARALSAAVQQRSFSTELHSAQLHACSCFSRLCISDE